VCSQPQVTGTDGQTHAPQILQAHHVPHPKAHVVPAIGQARHAASQQHIGGSLAPGSEVRARGFIQHRTRNRRSIAKLTAALQIRTDNGRQILGNLVTAFEGRYGKRKLRQSDTGNLHPELGMNSGQWHQRGGPPTGRAWTTAMACADKFLGELDDQTSLLREVAAQSIITEPGFWVDREPVFQRQAPLSPQAMLSKNHPELPPHTPLLHRLHRLWPYFASARSGMILAAIATLVGALTEPLIPALLKALLDEGFAAGAVPLWMVPAALLGLFGVRGLAGFLAQYALSYTAATGMLHMRRHMFERLSVADMKLFKEQTASGLSNTLVYEVQTGAGMLVGAFLTLTKDSLTLLALLGYLFYLNWKLTLIVIVIFPALILVMRVLSKRLYSLTQSSQKATDALAYVVEENVLAHRLIRLHGAQARTGPAVRCAEPRTAQAGPQVHHRLRSHDTADPDAGRSGAVGRDCHGPVAKQHQRGDGGFVRVVRDRHADADCAHQASG
jgi:hypothetical protein